MSQWTPLHQAAQTGNSDELKKLVESGANLNAVTKLDWTPLHFATKYDYLDCCRILIEAGAAMIMPTTLRFWTPCHLAALEGHTDIVQDKININSKSAVYPPLHCAADTEIVQILLNHGANPYLRSNEHKTALECQLQNKEIAALLRQVMSREPEN